MAVFGTAVDAVLGHSDNVVIISIICTENPMHENSYYTEYIMMSSNGNIFRVTGHLCGEFTGERWIPLTKASDLELW